MKAAYIQQPGPPDTIIYGDLPKPQPGPRQRGPRKGRGGQPHRHLPPRRDDRHGPAAAVHPGLRPGGHGRGAGPQAERFKPGDPVWGSNQGLLGRQGTFAEYAAVDERFLYPTPDGVGDRDAAAVALVGITAHLGLFRKARLAGGETLFVRGGTGGVGSCVVQMAHAVGVRVVTTAGSDEKARLAAELGADAVIRYKQEDVRQAIGRFAPAGLNVWWETLREPDLDLAIGCLAPRGRMILMAGRDARPSFPLGPFYTRDCALRPGHVQCHARGAGRSGGRHQSLAGPGEAPRPDRPGVAAIPGRVAHRLQEENTIGGRGVLAGKIVLEP